MKDEPQIIDAVFVEVHETARERRLLETVAAVAERVSKPFDQLPGGQRYAEKMRAAAVTVREVDGAIEDVKPMIAEIKGKATAIAEKLGLDGFSRRGVMSR